MTTLRPYWGPWNPNGDFFSSLIYWRESKPVQLEFPFIFGLKHKDPLINMLEAESAIEFEDRLREVLENYFKETA
jgi:hypothetical protein